MINFSTSQMSNGIGPTLRAVVEWFGKTMTLEFTIGTDSFADSLGDTILGAFRAIAPGCVTDQQCSGDTPKCSHSHVEGAGARGWTCVAACDPATESDLGPILGCWPRQEPGKGCLLNPQCTSRVCHLFQCTADCACSTGTGGGIVARGPCNTAGTDCLPCTDPSNGQYIDSGGVGSQTVTCHECLDTDHCRLQMENKWCDTSASVNQCKMCDPTCATCDDRAVYNGDDQKSCITCGAGRHFFDQITTGGHFCTICNSDADCASNEFCELPLNNPAARRCKSCNSPCATCTERPTQCRSCIAGRHYLNRGTRDDTCEVCTEDSHCPTGEECKGILRQDRWCGAPGWRI